MATGSGKSQSADETPKIQGEFRSGPVAGTALIAGVTFARKGLQYAAVDNLAIFEGDIVLGTVDEVQGAANRDAGIPAERAVGITGQQFRWPNARIPYDIDAALPNQQRVTDAIAHWVANTPIRFVLRTAANAAQFADYVHFQPGGGCSSAVGRRGGRQDITLAGGCDTGNAIHEIGHSVGLWHEQSREDRDTFIQIVWANIDPAMQFNFAQHIADGDDIGAYEYGSIMHYPPTAFSINGQATIIARQALPAGVVMGQRNGLSAGDIAAVNTMYPQAPTIKEVGKDPIQDTTKEVRKDPIQDTIKEVGKDPIRDTIKEVRKDPIQDTIKEVGKDPIRDTIKETGKDPIADTRIEHIFVPPLPGPQPGPIGAPSASPFVMATPSRAADATQVLAEANAQVEELAQALLVLEQQQAALLAAYEAAVQALDAIQQGQV